MPDPVSVPPDFFTVEEAARVLRIGRTAAYELARKWRASDGREGLPVVAFGRLLRVPRKALEEISGGPLATASTAVSRNSKPPAAKPARPTPAPSPLPILATPVVRRRRQHAQTRRIAKGQSTLPFN